MCLGTCASVPGECRTGPHTHIVSNIICFWGLQDLKMAANENALTQPKSELGSTDIIHNVFQGDKATRQKN